MMSSMKKDASAKESSCVEGACHRPATKRRNECLAQMGWDERTSGHRRILGRTHRHGHSARLVAGGSEGGIRGVEDQAPGLIKIPLHGRQGHASLPLLSFSSCLSLL